MAQNLDQIVFFRLLQGLFGAALSPLSQSIMLDLYPPEKRGQVMGIWGMGVMVGPILGPTVGGYLTEFYSWRWVFYVNVPVGIAAISGIWLFFRDSAHDAKLRFDWSGFAVLALGLGALQLMLDRGQSKDWFSSGEIIAEAVLGLLGLYLFTVHMLTTDRPFVPKVMFKDRNFASALLLMFLVGLILLASSALLPPYLQNLGGYTVIDTGLMMAPRGIGTMLAMMLVGRLSTRIDPRHLLALGTLMILWSMWNMAHWTPAIDTWNLVSATFVQGMGLGFVFVPATLVAFATLPAHLRTDASALMNLTRNIGSAIGVSLTTTVLANSVQTAHADLASHVTEFNRGLEQNAAGILLNPHFPFGLMNMNAIVERNAYVIAYANDFLFMFFVCIPVLVVIMMMRAPANLTTANAVKIDVID